MTNFYCLKWGTKYNRLYVNRLFKSLKKHYNNPFNFTCLTDNSTGIDPDIKIESIPDDFSEFPRTQIFTSEKMCYFDRYKHVSGPKAWFDLDILIQNNITDLVDRKKNKVTYIWNYWRNDEAAKINYGYMTTPINSSFVSWQDDVGFDMYERLVRNKEKAFFTYPSYDKYLFYQEHRKNNLDFWLPGNVYNYNIGCKYPDDLNPTEYRSDYKICLFNTSHKKWAKSNETHVELHEAKGWALDMWNSYDRI